VLRLIREHPVLGLVCALSLEAWIAVPGEAMIALAATAIAGEIFGWLRLAVSGIAGMLVNDLALFGLSRVGRGVLAQWIGVHALHFRLSADMVLGAKFIPPLRSAAYMIYGLQGAPFSRFLVVSLVSSAIWVCVYALAGRRFRGVISRAMDGAERRGGRWLTVAEVGLTIGAIAAIWL